MHSTKCTQALSRTCAILFSFCLAAVLLEYPLVRRVIALALFKGSLDYSIYCVSWLLVSGVCLGCLSLNGRGYELLTRRSWSCLLLWLTVSLISAGLAEPLGILVGYGAEKLAHNYRIMGLLGLVSSGALFAAASLLWLIGLLAGTISVLIGGRLSSLQVCIGFSVCAAIETAFRVSTAWGK